jgi:hypothetical protein
MPTPEQDPVTKEAAKALGVLVPEIYHDLLQPAAQEMGQKFIIVAKSVGVALAPLEASVWGYERIKEYLSAKVAAKLADKPPEEIKSPPTIIAGPVVMGMVFAAQEPHLREMYANLLANAMHAPVSSRVHPSFVQIIQQLSPAEAQILNGVAADFKGGHVLFREDVATLEDSNASAFAVFAGSGFSQSENVGVSGAWSDLCTKYEAPQSPLTNAFYRNFIRLGILDERIESTGGGVAIGQRFLQWEQQPARKLSRKIVLTDFGDLFLDVCVRNT